MEVNPSDVSRTAVVTLHSTSGVSSSIDIIQEPAGVTGSTETLTFEKEGGTKTVPIIAEAEWNANTSDSWIMVTPSSGVAGNHTLVISVLESNTVGERLGCVYVNIGGFSKLKIPVSQKGLYLEVNPTSLSFSEKEESKQIEVSSNTDWSVTLKPEWMNASTITGKNTQSITMTTQQNTISSTRNGIIIIEKEGLSLSAVVDVRQEGASLSVDQNNLQFSDKASTQDVVINTAMAWTASTSEEWIHLSKNSGTGKSTLSISVDENIKENERNGSVMIMADGIPQLISITQQGKYFTIDTQETMFDSHGGTHQISFSTNDDWTATVSDGLSWLTLSKTSGTSDAIIDVTAKDNASMKSRNGSIYIKPNNSQGVIIYVKQAGKYLTIDREKISFVPSGGTEIVKVETDGNYEVTTTNYWLEIHRVSQTSITVKAEENESGDREGNVSVRMTGLDDGETYEKTIKIEQEGGWIMNGHQYVDLGLPSGTLWATCNLGANSPSDKGNLYAWGDSIPKTEFYFWDYDYNNSYDAAIFEWGTRWKTPTFNQMKELVNSCEWVASYSGDMIVGYYAYGPNGKSIFFPMGCDSDPNTVYSRFWIKQLYEQDKMKAYNLRIDGSGTAVVITACERYKGAAIRPVVW